MFIDVVRSKYNYSRYECDDYLVNKAEELIEEDGEIVLLIRMYKRDELGKIISESGVHVSNTNAAVYALNNKGETIDKLLGLK